MAAAAVHSFGQEPWLRSTSERVKLRQFWGSMWPGFLKDCGVLAFAYSSPGRDGKLWDITIQNQSMFEKSYTWIFMANKRAEVWTCYIMLWYPRMLPRCPFFWIDIEPWLNVWPFAHTSLSEPNNLLFSQSFYLSLFSCIMMYSVHHFAKDVKNHRFMLIHEYLWKSSFHVAHIFFGEGCLNSVTVGKSSAPFF